MFWLWIWVAPMLLLAVGSLRGERKRAEYVAAGMAVLEGPPTRPFPHVMLVVSPGADPETRAWLAAQDYPHYEIVATPEAARAGAEIMVFAPSSGAAGARWLRALAAPFADPAVDAVTGLRWYAPELPTFWSLTRSVWNGIIAGRLGPGANEFAWPAGGVALRVPPAPAPRHIAFAPGAAVVDATRVTLLQFLRQAAGELAKARRRYPRLWLEALLAHLVYCGAMLAAALASYRGHRGAEWALVAQFGLGLLKGANRATLAKAQLPALQTWFDRYSWTHILWIPLVTWVWLYTLIASLFREV